MFHSFVGHSRGHNQRQAGPSRRPLATKIVGVNLEGSEWHRDASRAQPRSNRAERYHELESFVRRAAARLGRLAGKVRRIVDTLGAFVGGALRIGAYRTRAICDSIGTMRSEELAGRLSLLEPLRECADGVKCVGTFSTTAMSHPRKHEQADRISRRPAHRFQNTLVT